MATRVPWVRAGLLWLIGGPALALVIVAPSGRWDWIRGWTYLVLLLGCALVQTLATARWQPELIEQRTRRQAGTPIWDLAILGLLRLITLAGFVVSGWEAGRHPSIGVGGLVVGGLATVAGYGLLIRSIAENRFFEGTVRIQAERHQRVVDTGPYARVRHPGYVGFAATLLGGPLYLGSLPGTAVMIAAVALLAIRTVLEDRFLTAQLEGYAAYRLRVRYRWIPGIW
jgi:protein-S-isoprenylcysteine O-methyltransferase Ste14